MEIINIFFLTGVFIIFFSVSFPLLDSNKNIKISYSDNLILNILIQINIILLLSFLNVSIEKIIIFYLLYLVLFGIFSFKKILNVKSIISKKNYYYLFLLIIYLLLCFDISYSLTLGWDAQTFWFYKTINFFNGNTIDNLHTLPNPQYPFLGSLIWAVFWKISFFSEEYMGRLFYVFLYCISLFCLVEKLNSSNSTKIILFIFLVLLTYKYIYFDGSQDILIFCLISIAAKILYEIISNSQNDLKIFQIILFLLVCNSLIWTKQEGSVYALIIVLTLCFFTKVAFSKKILLFIFVISLFFGRILIYKFYNFDVSINPCCWKDMSINGIINKISIERSIIIFKFFIYSFLKNSLFLLALSFVVISYLSKDKLKNYFYIYFFYFMSYGFIYSAYITTDLDLVFMLKTGLDRLIFSASPLYILVIIEYVNSKKLKI